MLAQLNDATLFFDVVDSEFENMDEPSTNKPVMLALSGGYGYGHAYLRPSLDNLSSDYQIIYADMRGQGRSSDVPISTIQFDTMADDVAALITYLGLESVFVFGHASGSFIAQKLAIRHPAKVKGLILVSSSMGMTVLPGKDEEDYPTPFLKDRVQGELLDVAHNFFFNPNPLSEATFVDYATRVGPYYMAPKNMDRFDSIWMNVHYKMNVVNHFRSLNPFFTSLGKISLVKTPALIMSGFHDWATPSVGSHMLAKKMQHCDFVVFNDSGHFLFIEEPDRFYDQVKGFINKNSQV